MFLVEPMEYPHADVFGGAHRVPQPGYAEVLDVTHAVPPRGSADVFGGAHRVPQPGYAEVLDVTHTVPHGDLLMFLKEPLQVTMNSHLDEGRSRI